MLTLEVKGKSPPLPSDPGYETKVSITLIHCHRESAFPERCQRKETEAQWRREKGEATDCLPQKWGCSLVV